MSHYMRKNTLAAAVILAAFSLASAPQARADGSSPYLFGDWNGKRTELADRGIKFEFGHGSETAHNYSGGDRELTRYTDQWKLGTTLDLEKLWGWSGGTFQIMFTNRNGDDLGADANIGTFQLIQEVYGRGQTTHLTVFALNQILFGGKVDLRIGRLPVGEDFASFNCDFMNLTFCGAQPGNLVGDYWVNWPTSQWAARVKVNTSAETYVQVGGYQINPNYTNDAWAKRNGWKLNNPSGTTGALVPLEFGWTPKLNGLPGSYKLGGWYNNAGGSDLFYDTLHQPRALTGGSPLQRGARHGYFLTIQQQLTGEAGVSGTSVFFNVAQADKNTSATDRQIAVGVQYKAPFQRANDFVGLAFGATHGSERAGDYQRLFNQLYPTFSSPVRDGNEYVTELFYSWSPIASIALRPNLQYIRHPGGTGDNSDAFILGLKTSVNF